MSKTYEEYMENVKKENLLFYNKIKRFINNNNTFRKPLEEILKLFFDLCTYENGESLERHNFGEQPKLLDFIPKKINNEKNKDNIEKNLITYLKKNKRDKIDYSIIELLLGEVQSGKRIHACIIMWISLYILNIPILYIFRNLTIDKKQLANDIIGQNKNDFNINFINKFKIFILT